MRVKVRFRDSRSPLHESDVIHEDAGAQIMGPLLMVQVADVAYYYPLDLVSSVEVHGIPSGKVIAPPKPKIVRA